MDVLGFSGRAEPDQALRLRVCHGFPGFGFDVSKGSPRHRLQLRRQRLLQVRALQADLLRDGADDRDLLAPRFVGLEQAVAERLESREQ